MEILLAAVASLISLLLIKIMSKSPTTVVRWLGILSILFFTYLGFVSWKELQTFPKEPKHMNLFEASSLIPQQIQWVIADDLQWDCDHIFYKEVNGETHTYIIFTDKGKSVWGFSFFSQKMTCDEVAHEKAVGILDFANSAQRADVTSLGFDLSKYETNSKFLSLCTYCGTNNSRTGVIIASIMVIIGASLIVASNKLEKKNRLPTNRIYTSRQGHA
jgi:hypothetical protein